MLGNTCVQREMRSIGFPAPLSAGPRVRLTLCVPLYVSPETVPYTPQITAKSLEGKLTATTFTLDQPICIFDQYVNGTDDIWLVVAFTNVLTVDYEPAITLLALEGNITSSTFVLEQPRCVFNQTVSDTDEIWLVVSLSRAISSFTRPTSLQSLPAFQQFPENPNYMTMGTSSLNYPCEKSSGQITVLRVGNETGCVLDTSRPDCNGPLPGPGPYRVKFLAMSPATGPKAETKWSAPITLKRGN
ncbi:Uroplakin-3b [Chelonia mydas]|uniref:Uroplakin-3b n=1 Tax=Chelonia mydas TaxID=8469 RepID=M7B9P1_CHEMY|nr:Uroplakin-3b [Chelonia mydas]